MSKVIKSDDLAGLFRSGDRIYIPGSSSEPRAVVSHLHAISATLGKLEFVVGFVSGINTVSLCGDGNQLTETRFFPRSDEDQLGGRVRTVPLSYYGIHRYLAGMDFDWVIAHVSPVDMEGNCSLGVSAEFLPSVVGRAKKILGVINSQMPRVASAPVLPYTRFDAVLEVNDFLMEYQVGEIDDVSMAIGDHISGLIEPGSTLQAGLGKIPEKVLSGLRPGSDIRIHSGMISDSFLACHRKGVLDPEYLHTTCSALGSVELYRSLPGVENLEIRGTNETHAPARLAGIGKLIAINSAINVDLNGQANLEQVKGKSVSSVGGAADFARAAALSVGGMSIIALPATVAGGKVSRIVSGLDSPGLVSLPRHDVDFIVTEFGVARMKGCSGAQRAENLIRVAAPQHREQLMKQWSRAR
jgi:acyl-CoA hydrolase